MLARPPLLRTIPPDADADALQSGLVPDPQPQELPPALRRRQPGQPQGLRLAEAAGSDRKLMSAGRASSMSTPTGWVGLNAYSASVPEWERLKKQGGGR